MVTYEVKPNSNGYWIYKDKEKLHFSLSSTSTIISVLSNSIRAESKDGGKIIIHSFFEPTIREVIVDGCPTNHKKVVDDFVGGNVCLDCKAVF